MPVENYEQLGLFYLGGVCDAATLQPTGEPLLYDSRDLVTHALCVGMTGSGKTGLAIGLIEEAALDGVPVIAIDPKGDLGNLLLTFPQLAAADFAPWINADEAARAGVTAAEFAAAEAAKWQAGLEKSGQDGARIERLRAAAEFALYTPGSSAGLPVSVLRSFDPPAVRDHELLAEQAQSLVSGLLALVAVEGDPLTSPEHVLLTSIVVNAWEQGQRLDLAALIQRVQSPPMQTVGVLPVDEFMPPRARTAVAMALNSLLAAPGFKVWTEGDALDAAAFLRTADGRPRVSIFSIAHLDDSQRMFFVTQLLSNVVAWMRAQSGTGSLRALLYMDEIFGFFPPVANPPSKQPLLTLLKQARAYGLGVVLATQNPVDLDYKALGNIGTWWLGRLQTERDKQRLLDGLEGVAGGALERAEVDRLISALPKRTFLMRNVHDPGLELFQTRWAMSYLRGPLGREDIQRLVRGEAGHGTAPKDVAGPTEQAETIPAPAPQPAAAATSAPPVVAAEVPAYYAPAEPGDVLRAALFAECDVGYSSARYGVDSRRTLACETEITSDAVAVDWNRANASEFQSSDLSRTAPHGVSYEPLPAAASKVANYAKWERQLKAWIRDAQPLELHKFGKLVSEPGESLREFNFRVEQALREERAAELDKLRSKFATKHATLEGKVQRAQLTLQREQAESASQKLDTALSVGATLAGALLGGRSRRSVTAAARGAGRAVKQGQDVARAREALRQSEAALAELDAQLSQEVARLQMKQPAQGIERLAVKAKSADIQVRLLALVWKPTS